MEQDTSGGHVDDVVDGLPDAHARSSRPTQGNVIRGPWAEQTEEDPAPAPNGRKRLPAGRVKDLDWMIRWIFTAGASLDDVGVDVLDAAAYFEDVAREVDDALREIGLMLSRAVRAESDLGCSLARLSDAGQSLAQLARIRTDGDVVLLGQAALGLERARVVLSDGQLLDAQRTQVCLLREVQDRLREMQQRLREVQDRARRCD